MALSTQPYKGTRDFYPEDKRLQKYMFGVWRSVAERFGYEEYDAPILEPLEIYLAKSGDEIAKEQTYLFADRAGRKVAIRPEMTPTVSRMVAARRQELAYPLRWYSIPNLWRYERPQRGRLREHWQLNVDIFGVDSTGAEQELITLVDAMFKAFGAKPDMYNIRLNSRALMNYCLHEYLGLNETAAYGVSKLIDRIHKLEHEEFMAQADALLTPKQREEGVLEKLLGILAAKKVADLPDTVQKQPCAVALDQLLKSLWAAGISNSCFDITIMRGFDYYTGIVFEVFDTNPENNRAMLGGGRYDGLVGLFGVAPVPTIGFGWGDVTLINFLRTHHLLPELPPETDVYAVMIGRDTLDAAQSVLAALRAGGVNVAADLSGRKLSDQFKVAEKKGISRLIIIGEKELADERYTLKNLQSGEEAAYSLPALIEKLQQLKAEEPAHH